MKYTEISEACWSGYQQQGMKKKGDRMVPNCVPVSEDQVRDNIDNFRPNNRALDRLHHDFVPTWQMLNHRVLKTSYDFADDDTALEFVQAVKLMGEDIDHNGVITLDNAQVTVEITTHDVQGLTRLDFEYALRTNNLAHNMQGDQVPHPTNKLDEIKTGPEMTLNDLLYTAAAKAMHQAGLEGVPMDYEEAIKKAAKIYKIPYTPSELPRLLAQRAEIDRKLAMLKQGKQVAKARRKEKLAPTPAGAEEYWRTHALPTDRIKPPAKTLEETEAELAEDLKKWFREKWVRFGPDGKIRGDCARGSSKEGKPKCLPQSKAHALGKKGRAAAAAKKRREDPNPERRGPARNVATKVREQGVAEGLIYSGDTWEDVLYRINVLNDIFGDQKDLAATFEPASQPEWIPFRDRILRSRTVLDTYAKVKQLANMNVPLTDVEIEMLDDVAWDGGGGPVEPAGHWGRRDYDWLENLYAQQFAVVQHLLDQRAQGYGQNKTKSGQTVHEQGVAEVKEQYTDDDDWYDEQDDRLRDGDYVRDRQDGKYGEIFRMSGDPSERRVRILDRGGKGWYISPDRLVAVDPTDPDIQKYFGKKRRQDIDEKQDACYRKVKSRYKVWPSAYASGALVQCRKKGAANWGTGAKKK